jgi:hypothetical protein
LAVPLEGDVFRIFFSGRDAQNRSSVGFADVDLVRREVVRMCKQPVFEYGPDGTYYSHGVSIGNCYEAEGRRYILFMGWHCPPDGHWRGEIGRLAMRSDFSLKLQDDRAYMATDATDPISLSYPSVIPRDESGYHMWYGSTVTWDAGNGEMLHVINHATSQDGHHWQRHGLAVPYLLGIAQAFSHPSVVGNPREGYQMWFSYRGGAGDRYRIGYAVSHDAETWELRLDESGIEPSASGWDSEMIEHPFVFDHEGKRFMLYNGNGYGGTGFGLAVLEA